MFPLNTLNVIKNNESVMSSIMYFVATKYNDDEEDD